MARRGSGGRQADWRRACGRVLESVGLGAARPLCCPRTRSFLCVLCVSASPSCSAVSFVAVRRFFPPCLKVPARGGSLSGRLSALGPVVSQQGHDSRLARGNSGDSAREQWAARGTTGRTTSPEKDERRETTTHALSTLPHHDRARALTKSETTTARAGSTRHAP